MAVQAIVNLLRVACSRPFFQLQDVRLSIDMAEIEGVTLRMAIQAVDAMINDLAKQFGADGGPQASRHNRGELV